MTTNRSHIAGIPASIARNGDTLFIFDDVRAVIFTIDYGITNNCTLHTRCIDPGDLDVIKVGNPFALHLQQNSQIEILSRGATVPPLIW